MLRQSQTLSATSMWQLRQAAWGNRPGQTPGPLPGIAGRRPARPRLLENRHLNPLNSDM
jgi:hypothetical protein